MFKSKFFRKIAGSWLKVGIWFIALVAVVTIQSGAFRAQDAEASIEITATVNDPVIDKVQPSTGPTEGNLRVNISGTNFTNVIAVTFGGVNVQSFTTASDNQISAVIPPGQPGAVKVVVITEDKAGALDNGFTYVAPATATSVPSPTVTTGPATPAATPTGASETALPTTTTPTGGELTTTPGGSVTPDQITAPVTVTTTPGATQATTPEGTPVLSTTLAMTAGATTITPTEAALIATPAPSLSPVVTPTVTPEDSLTPGPTTTVAPTTPEENSPTPANTPTISPSISPTPFPTTADLTTVTPSPTAGLSPSVTPATASPAPSTLAATVTVSPATETIDAATVSATPELDATATAIVAPTATPELTATPTAIVAPTPTPASSPSPSPTVAVEEPPTIAGVSPAQGSVEGGTTVTVTGSNFSEDTEVTFGGLPPTSVVINSPTRITVVTAPQQAGTISIVVKNEGGLASLANGFTYVADSVVISQQPTNFNYTGKLNGKTLILKSSFKIGVKVTGTNPAGWRLVARSTVLSSGSVSIPATNHTIQNVQVVSNNGVAPANNLAYPLIFPVNSDTIFSAAPGTGTGETILTFETQLVIPPGIPAGSYKLSLNVDVVSGDAA